MANLLGYIGVFLNFCWPLFRSRKYMLAIQALAGCFFAVHFYLLEAVTGSLMVFIASIQAVVAVPLKEKPKLKIIYILTIPIIALLLILSWNGSASVFSSLALALVSLGRYQLDIKKFRIYLIFSIFCWIGHSLLIGSIPGLISDFLGLSTSLWMYNKQKN